MDVTNFLEKIGITREEYLIYKEILESPPRSIVELSKRTGLHRPAIYKLIDSLIQKQLIKENTNKRLPYLFISESPEELLKIAQKEKQKFNEEISQFENYVRFLKNNYPDKDRDVPNIQIIEGPDTVDKLDQIILKNNSPLKGFSYIYNVKSCFKVDKDGHLKPNEYLEVVLSLTDKFVFPADKETINFVKDFQNQNPILKNKWLPRWLPKEEFFFNINFYVFGDHIAFALGEYGEKDYLAYIIKNAEIARSMASLTEYMWNRANPI